MRRVVGFLFLPLGDGDVVAMCRVVSVVRRGQYTEVLLSDGSVVTSSIRPRTLAKRAHDLMRKNLTGQGKGEKL